MPGPAGAPDHVFGYGSLAELRDPLPGAGGERAPVLGRLLGYRRLWGVAMNNWEAPDGARHWVDPDSGERPRIRVSYLDIEERPGATANGLAIPVDEARLAELDAREGNYERFDVSAAFRPGLPGRVFSYRGLDAARERCRQGAADGDVFVSSVYLGLVHRSFSALGAGALAEFEATTELPFPVRELRLVPRRG
jgi:hypothetical protein